MASIDSESFVTLEQLKLFWPPAQEPVQFNEWTIGVLVAAAGVYTFEVQAIPYTFTAVGGDTETVIRDGLLADIAAAAAHPDWVEAPDSTDQLTITGTVSGQKLPVVVTAEPASEALLAVEDTPITIYYTDEIITCQLELLECEFNRRAWGCALWRGHLNLAIHTLKCLRQGSTSAGPGVTGTITSLRQGPYAASFGQSPTSGPDGTLSSSKEGQEYIRLRDSLGPQVRALRTGVGCRSGRRRHG